MVAPQKSRGRVAHDPAPQKTTAPKQSRASYGRAAALTNFDPAKARKNIPQALRALGHWLVWRYEAPDKPDAKPRKVPYYVTGKKRHGTLGSKADTAQLASFDDALAAVQEGAFDGIGLAVLPQQDLTIIDLDNCIDDAGVYSEFADTVTESGTYVEHSPSGRGLRAVYSGALVPDQKRNFHIANNERVEVYCGKAFVTFTGRSIGQSCEVAPLPASMGDTLRAGMGDTGGASDTSDAGDALMSMNAAPLPKMTAKQALRVLKALPQPWGASGSGTWFRAAGAIHMQFRGSEEGYAVLDEWSRDLEGYSEAENRKRWEAGFSHQRGKQAVTSMRNLVFEARDAGAEFAPGTLAAWGLSRNGTDTQPAGPGELVLRAVSGSEMRAIRWLWRGYIAKGYLNLGAGETGAGKTNVLMHVASVVTRGGRFPGEDVDAALDRQPGRVLYLGNEDSIAEMIAPRLTAEGGDLSLVLEIAGVMRDGERDYFSMQDDMEAVRKTIDRYKDTDAPVELLVIDPVTAYLGGRTLRRVDLGDNGQLRQILTPWATLAEETGIAIVALTHLTKDTTRNVLHRVLGAQVFTALCRSLLYVVKLPAEGQHMKALFQVKTNLPGVVLEGGLRYETVLQQVGTDRKTGEPIQATRVEWGEVDSGLTLESLAGGSRGPESQYGPQFRGWLRGHFASHPEHDELPVAKVKAAAMADLGFALSWWEKHSGQFLERRNVGGVWYCRPAG